MKQFFGVLLLWFFCLTGAAQATRAMINFADPIVVEDNYTKKKTTRKMGIYISEIYDLNAAADRFSVEYRTWSYGAKGSEISYMEFPQTQRCVFSGAQEIHIKDSVWRQMHVSATYNYDWDMTNFPFDKQTLEIVCENSVDTSLVELVGDSLKSGIAPNAISTGFVITDVRFMNDIHRTDVDFGNPLMEDGEESNFSQYIAQIDIERDAPWTLFLKVFAAVIVSFIISTIVFIIKPQHFDVRFALPIGSLFAAVGSKFVVDSVTGISTLFTLVDKIYVLTYVLIFLVTLLLLVSNKVNEKNSTEYSKPFLKRRLDVCLFLGVNLVYFGVIAALLCNID